MNRIMILFLMFVLTLVPVSMVVSDESKSSADTIEFTDVTIAQILSDPNEYNNDRVALEGFVDKVKYTKSSKGEPFTLFRLNDGTKNEVRVYYEDEHLALSKGDKVKIQGRYKKQKKYLLYKIKNVIKARTVEKLADT